ncbi:hypothetical protein BKI52_02825 [marine bacterium AO1-C]|nr:hypothetical protein BKI52_02825 [marine bacterium AO1-C]
MSKQAEILIKQNLDTKEPTLDLSYCGLWGTETIYSLWEEQDSSHIEKLILSNLGVEHNITSQGRVIKKMQHNGKENRLSQIPHALPSNLKELILAKNYHITDLTPLKNLTELEILDIGHNQIVDLTPLEHLKKLRVLNLPSNQITDISPLSQLKNLNKLNLFKNKIQSLEPLLGHDKLTLLLAMENQISSIDLGLLNSLTALESLFLYNNPVENVPKEIYNRKKNVLAELRNYLESIKKDEVSYLHQAKMLLIGNGKVGKTSIRRKLLDKEASLPKDEERTPGLEIEPYIVKGLKVDELETPIDFELNIWDFGGQGRYREVQHLFCSRKALYIFVTTHDDHTGEEDYVGWEYWLSLAKAYGYDTHHQVYSPTIHVINKLDEDKDFEVDNSIRKNLFPNIHDFIKISCVNLTNFAQLEQAIRQNLFHIGQGVFTDKYNQNWFKLKKLLETRRHENHMTYEAYLTLCQTSEFGLNEVDALQWLDVLDRIGNIIYFRDHPTLKDWIILNPLWVKDAMYKVLDYKHIQNGRLNPGFFEDIWQGYTAEEHEKLLELMLAYKFCYALIDQFNTPFYIVPSLLSVQPPTLPLHLQSFEFQFTFRYQPFLPAGTVNKLMVVCKDMIFQQLQWKNNVVVHQIQPNGKTAYAHITEDWENTEVKVKIKWDDQGALFNKIHETLFDLNQELKETKLMEQLEFEIYALHKGKFKLLQDLEDFGVPEFTPFFSQGTEDDTFQPPNSESASIQATIQQALEYLESGDFASFFEEMQQVTPSDQRTTLNQLKGQYIAGNPPYDFNQRLRLFALDINDFLNS